MSTSDDEENKSIVSRAADTISAISQSKNIEDHARALALTAVGYLPILGPALSTLITEYVPSSREQAKERALHDFLQKLADIQARVDAGVDKEEFAELWSGMERITSKTNREIKLRAAANILANLFLKAGDPAKCVFSELDYFMHCLDALSSGAIAVLGASRKALGINTAVMNERSITMKDLHRQLPDMDLDLLMNLARELAARNLLHITEGIIGSNDYDSYSIRPTPSGGRFAERIIEGSM